MSPPVRVYIIYVENESGVLCFKSDIDWEHNIQVIIMMPVVSENTGTCV